MGWDGSPHVHLTEYQSVFNRFDSYSPRIQSQSQVHRNSVNTSWTMNNPLKICKVLDYIWNMKNITGYGLDWLKQMKNIMAITCYCLFPYQMLTSLLPYTKWQVPLTAWPSPNPQRRSRAEHKELLYMEKLVQCDQFKNSQIFFKNLEDVNIWVIFLVQEIELRARDH